MRKCRQSHGGKPENQMVLVRTYVDGGYRCQSLDKQATHVRQASFTFHAGSFTSFAEG